MPLRCFWLVLKFTPLEFETRLATIPRYISQPLKFTPLEFETYRAAYVVLDFLELKFTPLEFETTKISTKIIAGEES